MTTPYHFLIISYSNYHLLVQPSLNFHIQTDFQIVGFKQSQGHRGGHQFDAKAMVQWSAGNNMFAFPFLLLLISLPLLISRMGARFFIHPVLLGEIYSRTFHRRNHIS